MNCAVHIVLASAVLFSGTAVKAQEFSEATYVGGVAGAAHACAQFYPANTTIYNETVYRTVSCHLGPVEAVHWHKRLQTVMPYAAQYKAAYRTAKADVENAPNNIRTEQCGSIERMVCHANSPPDVSFRKK